MTVPTYDTFIGPLLAVLAKTPAGLDAGEAHDAVADAVGISDEDRALMLPSGGQLVFKNRVGWAHDRLKRAGYSGSPKRGFWQLTPAGFALAKEHPVLPLDVAETIADCARTSRLRPKAPSPVTDERPHFAEVTVSPPTDSPDDRIEQALEEMQESVGRDLLERIGQSTPSFFEALVLKLLRTMGYGANDDAIQRVGGSNDGGIDGIISLDRLGLEKIYVQAKRWKNTVGSPEIQGFMGALQLQSASKGVFITTSSFTKEAKDAARRARGTIVLVDGRRLTELMIEHGVAVNHRAVKVPTVDSDFFEV